MRASCIDPTFNLNSTSRIAQLGMVREDFAQVIINYLPIRSTPISLLFEIIVILYIHKQGNRGVVKIRMDHVNVTKFEDCSGKVNDDECDLICDQFGRGR